jgi:hypothetical protein
MTTGFLKATLNISTPVNERDAVAIKQERKRMRTNPSFV